MSPSFPNRNVPFKTRFLWGIAGGSMIRNPTSSTGDTGSSPDPRWSHRPQSNWACLPQWLSLCSKATCCKYSRLPREISIHIRRWHQPYGRKQRETKEPLDEDERGEWKSLRLNIQKMKIMASRPITSWQIDGKTMEIVRDFTWVAPKSLQIVAAAMKLRDACSLEEKLWPTQTAY